MSEKACPQCHQRFPSDAVRCPRDGARLSPVSPSNSLQQLVGRLIDERYRVLAQIGEGGMGVVFRGIHAFTQRPVAIKVLRAEFASETEPVARFLQEAQSASRIGQENIIEIYDAGILPSGEPYFIMEHLEGKNLAALVRRGPLPLERAVDIGIQLCRGLAAAHRVGIIHRDIKPENIFVVPRPSGGDLVKILDFGIAKILDQEANLTKAGAILGTPQYMSPEQSSGADADARSDIYSVGVILYEMVTGRQPFTGTTMMAILSKQLLDDPVPPGRIRNGLWSGLEALILKCLKKEPGARYQSMEELEAALMSTLGPRSAASFSPNTVRAAPPRAVSEPNDHFLGSQGLTAALEVIQQGAGHSRPGQNTDETTRVGSPLRSGQARQTGSQAAAKPSASLSKEGRAEASPAGGLSLPLPSRTALGWKAPDSPEAREARWEGRPPQTREPARERPLSDIESAGTLLAMDPASRPELPLPVSVAGKHTPAPGISLPQRGAPQSSTPPNPAHSSVNQPQRAAESAPRPDAKPAEPQTPASPRAPQQQAAPAASPKATPQKPQPPAKAPSPAFSMPVARPSRSEPSMILGAPPKAGITTGEFSWGDKPAPLGKDAWGDAPFARGAPPSPLLRKKPHSERSKQGLIIGLGAGGGGILVFALVYIFFLAPSSSPTEATPPSPTPSPETLAATEPASIPTDLLEPASEPTTVASVTPPAPDPVSPEAPSKVEKPEKPEKPKPEKTTPPKPEKPSPPEKTEPKPTVTETFKIMSNPSKAQVFLNGALLGTTPLDVAVADSPRTFVLKKEGFKEAKRTVPAGRASLVMVALDPADPPPDAPKPERKEPDTPKPEAPKPELKEPE